MGLSLLIPDYWWPGYDSDETSNGVSISINFSNTRQLFFNVSVDGNVYAMRYDAVFLYADEKQRGHDRYCLPHHPVTTPEGEIWTRPSTQNQDDADDTNASIEEHVRYIQTDAVDWKSVDNGSG